MAIIEDVAWLGYPLARGPLFASDYFGQLADWAELLISNGLAYVDDQDGETISEQRGGYGKPGIESPFRDRAVEENLALFARPCGRVSSTRAPTSCVPRSTCSTRTCRSAIR